MKEQILESGQSLSQSLLWKLQEAAYCQFGIGAWAYEGVPFYITSNPYTAKCYARMVWGFLKEIEDKGQIDRRHPIYFLDLGAGSGRFAFFFLKELFRLLAGTCFSDLKIRYVMTDIVESNLIFCQEHLKPYFDSGVIETAYFHHAQSSPISLKESGKILDENLLVNPLILIANYFFDTIPQDLFRVKDGKLEEGKVTLVAEGEALPPISNPEIIPYLRCRYSYSPISTQEYYLDPDMEAVLRGYEKEFDGSTFTFPIGALQIIRSLTKLARHRLLFIAGDQGVTTPEQIREWGEPQLSLHGSFSIAVSYHALSLFVRRLGGQALLTSFSEPSFVVMAGMFFEKSLEGRFGEIENTFLDHMDSFEPRDYWRLVSLVLEESKSPSLEYLLLLIKLGNWDPMTFHAFFPLLREKVVQASETQKRKLVATIDKVWEHFYPIAPEEADFVLNLGVLLFDLKDYQGAIKYFERSMEIAGANETALKNIALCRVRLQGV